MSQTVPPFGCLGLAVVSCLQFVFFVLDRIWWLDAVVETLYTSCFLFLPLSSHSGEQVAAVLSVEYGMAWPSY